MPAPTILENYAARGEEDSYYVQENWSKEGFPVSFAGGGRIDHGNTTHQGLFSPRGGVAASAGKGFTVRAGFGLYYQFPDFDKLFGFFGNPRLQADKAIHYNLRLERELNPRTRVVVEGYARQDRGSAFSLAEPRLGSDGKPTIASNPYDNLLDGYARGLEFTLQRRTANGFTGWISYGYSRTWLKDATDSLAFASDVDQRHTLNVFASRRMGRTVNLSGQFRYGSGQPVVGFLKRDGPRIELGSERNQLRLDDYARLDLRATKSFLHGRWKWTLSGEVLNLLNHKNTYNLNSDLVRFRLTGSYSIGIGDSFGILPAAGIHIEF